MAKGRYAKANFDDEDTLVDLLDRLLDHGLVVHGDLRLAVANVDLIFVGLKLFVCSIDTIDRTKPPRSRVAPDALAAAA